MFGLAVRQSCRAQLKGGDRIMSQIGRGAALVAALAIIGGTVATVAEARIPARWRNYAAVNHRYPHGVGRFGAHNATGGVPVRNFFHSTRVYRVAVGFNKGLDR